MSGKTFIVTCAVRGRPSRAMLIFSARNQLDAIESAHRWYLNRLKRSPDLFSNVVSYTVAGYHVGGIAPDGSGNSHPKKPFYEWVVGVGGRHLTGARAASSAAQAGQTTAPATSPAA